MDSGAESSVAPPDYFGTPVIGSPMSSAGACWVAANGSKIPALGQTEVEFEDSNSRDRVLRFEVAEVQDPLISTADVCDAGNLVIFHKKSGIIYNLASQTRTPFERRGGRYELAMTLPPGKEEDEGASASNCQAASLRRPEK